ncbi:hydroxymethylglutaryl-CoA reductase [Marinicauda algicola]|uniref:hydroxymethylglutaryl-CoA reductase (NADPH) n=1 Tax=Marinicauda algicola TaxID=2029849 RepID=A0A4S2H1K4_9PROT|nr:hydroxymethylglutaryl-CoA reductase [Marinicauda algicola]TGY89303.1 hydroxymethylglutaryl-CoA reductase [Marinicauda algicola]
MTQRPNDTRLSVPRDRDNDYTPEAARMRREFVSGRTGADLSHTGSFSFDPAVTRGNIENFIGVAQVPVGLAGPLRIEGEHVSEDVYVPLATTEGTLVASYNRGMRILTEAGGVKTTIHERFMQRAPVFHFNDARGAREFAGWVESNLEQIRMAAEASSSIAKLSHVERYAVGPMLHLRFNYETGDAAGQNMAGKATFAACEWIAKSYPGGARYTLSGAMDTDKKHSQLNVLHSRGARVIAEARIPSSLLRERVGVAAEDLFRARLNSFAGSVMAGSANNGMHAANALAALFIACGQDAANVAESHAAMTYVRLEDGGETYYWSITLPALIVATFGGGTGLPTQAECLDILGCRGKGKVRRFIEICAATVLAGEVSLAGAVVAGDWVESHEKLGRNRG